VWSTAAGAPEESVCAGWAIADAANEASAANKNVVLRTRKFMNISRSFRNKVSAAV